MWRVIICKTPYRVGLLGGGSDLPAWFSERPGAVLSAAISRYCWITCRYLPPFFDHRSRFVWSQIERVNSSEAIQHPAIRACLEFMNMSSSRLEVHHDGDLPARSGMGTSSAFSVGLLHALHSLQGTLVSKRQLALEAIEVDQDIVKEAVGCQDHITAAHGGINHLTFYKTRESFTASAIPLSASTRDRLQHSLMLFYTGVARDAAVVEAAKIAELPSKTDTMQQMVNMVDRGIRLLIAGDLDAFGALIGESWELKKQLSPLVSSSFIDSCYSRAIKAGALGGKLCGAGSGGVLLFYVPQRYQAAVKHELKDLLHIPFEFDYSGSQLVYYDQDEETRAAG